MPLYALVDGPIVLGFDRILGFGRDLRTVESIAVCYDGLDFGCNSFDFDASILLVRDELSRA